MRWHGGRRRFPRTKVTIEGRPLCVQLDLQSHSLAEFEWGRGGEGSAQLVLAILADHCKNGERAVNFHQRFKWAVIAALPYRKWVLTTGEIEQILQKLHNLQLRLEAVL